MSSYEEEQQELKKALSTIFYFFSSRVYLKGNWRVYYKEKGRDPAYIDPFSDTPLYTIDDYANKLVDLLTDLAEHKDLEFVVAIGEVKGISPTEECLKYKRGHDYRQFFQEAVLFTTYESYTEPFKSMTDPLDQIFLYYRRSTRASNQRFKHVYLCDPVYLVKPYRNDISSIFHGMEGVVAYCVTLPTFERNAYGAYKSYYDKMSDLYGRIKHKMDELMKNDPHFSCDVSQFQKEFKNELEEADKVMREYGVIRVAFPLS